MTTFGSHKDPSRITTWKREFDQFVKDGNLPKFSMLRLMRDHTAGTGEEVSASPKRHASLPTTTIRWVKSSKRSATALLEEHGDMRFGRRCAVPDSTTWIATDRPPSSSAPGSREGKVDSHFYNTDSMLRTMELVLGLKPLSQYDAIAAPINVFSRERERLRAIRRSLAAKHIIGEINAADAYRASDSVNIIAHHDEDSRPDIELNDILWGSIRAPERAQGPLLAWAPSSESLSTRTGSAWITAPGVAQNPHLSPPWERGSTKWRVSPKERRRTGDDQARQSPATKKSPLTQLLL